MTSHMHFEAAVFIPAQNTLDLYSFALNSRLHERINMGDKRIVAAIDFGTCNTRVCFARNTKDFKSLEFFEMDDWKLAPHGRDMAPTSVLLDKKGDPLAYGFEAEDMFKNREEEDHFYFFKNFKMELHDINVS